MEHWILVLFGMTLSLAGIYKMLCFFWKIVRFLLQPLPFLLPSWVKKTWLRRKESADYRARLKETQERATHRLEHYFYRQDQFVNIGFVEEDRKLLFNGHEKIGWRWGKKSINPETYTREASHKLCFMMFLEMNIYRDQFLKRGSLWTKEMEILWQKMLPPKYKQSEKQDPSERLKKIAVADFELDDSPKKIAS